MKIAGMIMAATAALSIIGSSAFAEQMRTGMVTRIDRISGTISIKDIPDGTVGANTGAATEEFKVQDGARLNVLHAGDRVTFAVSEIDGDQDHHEDRKEVRYGRSGIPFRKLASTRD